MKKIIISLSIIAAAAAIVIGGTIAYFSDTETSTGNTFTAGAIDLMVDSECHFNGMACTNGTWGDTAITCACTWPERNLAGEKFFDFADLKPGDSGEVTLSMHVYDNDAWGRLIIDNLIDSDNTCVEPELIPVDPHCIAVGPSATPGELRQNLKFWVWLDDGTTPGFQCPTGQPKCTADPQEGNNFDDIGEIRLIAPGPINAAGETWNLYDGLKAVYDAGRQGPGLNSDGHMTGSVTYYFGIGWQLPSNVGNDVQSDTFVGDMTLQVVQYRNNISPSGSPLNW